MLFNSFDFAFFFPLVFFLYWFLNRYSLKKQNLFLVIASYIFYGWWDYRFLALIAFSTVLDYTIGYFMSHQSTLSKRKLLLVVSLVLNLGLLGVFKYYNFFVQSFVDTFSMLGYRFEPNSLNIILPVGISFYTFQTLSYTIDVYRDKLTPTKSFVDFAAFVCFFPQLVAGPIERATNLLPQFSVKRKFEYAKAVDGMRQILWGFFKKIVIADNCARYVNIIFADYENFGASTLLLGAVFFAFQIYGDFSGYSDIAIGISRLLGFNLKQNFAFPYFSRDISEFWRRWHISLSTWFRDYVYIPLGGSRGTTIKKLRNVIIVFAVSGLWHGANWTFVVWGLLNAAYFIPLLLAKKNRTYVNEVVASNSYLPSLKEVAQITLTFGLTVIGWIYFRSENITMANQYIFNMMSDSMLSLPEIRPSDILLIIVVFICVEWLGRRDQYAIEKLWLKKPLIVRMALYQIIALIIFLYAAEPQEFIYFQF